MLSQNTPVAAHQLAADIVSWLLPQDFPPPRTRSFGDEEIVDLVVRARINDAEAIALWCYVYLIAHLSPEVRQQGESILPLLALRPGHTARASEAMRRVLAKLKPRPTADELIRRPAPYVVQIVTELVAVCLSEITPPPVELIGLQPASFEHPQSLSLLAAIKRLPILPEMIAQVGDFVRTAVEVDILANGILVTENSLPWLYDCFMAACHTLSVPDRPRLYIRAGGLAAHTIGMDAPAIVVESMAVSMFDRNEMIFLLGRELGHILAGHAKYLSVAETLLAVAGGASAFTLGVGGPLIDSTLGLPLYRWCRYAEYSADRAGYLACQNREAVLRGLYKLAGFPARYYRSMRTRWLVEQAEAFRLRLDENALEQMFNTLSRITQREPFIIPRTAELLAWEGSGDYARVLDNHR